MAPPEHPYPQGERIRALEADIAFLKQGQTETRELMREHAQTTKTQFDELRAALQPLIEAFQKAKGFQAALILVAIFLTAGVANGAKEILSWLLHAVKP